MDNIMRWYYRNYTQITWFLIGWLAMLALTDFSKGDWAGVAFDFALIAINYFIWKK
jgi:hypothetical protein